MDPPSLGALCMRLSDHVAEQLCALVQQRQLQPGQRLPAERQLAAELGVSRVALREAIQQLSSRGMLESRMGSGTFVRAPAALWSDRAISPLAPLLRDDPQYRYDVLEARQIIEVSTAWLAAQRATDQDRDNIRRCFDAMLHHQQRQDGDNAARADTQFHLAIAEASHNVVVVQVMRSLFDMVLNTVAQNRREMFVHKDPKVLERLTQQHQDLMQAIVQGEPEQARAVIGEHLAFVHAKLAEADAEEARQQRLGRFSSTQHKPFT